MATPAECFRDISGFPPGETGAVGRKGFFGEEKQEHGLTRPLLLGWDLFRTFCIPCKFWQSKYCNPSPPKPLHVM